VAVFGQASGVAFFPFISKLAVEQQFKKMTSLLNTVLTKIVLYLIPLSGIMIVLAHEIIAVLFQHGKFNAASTAATAPVLSIYLLGAFGFSAVMIINRSFYAMQNTMLPMIVSTLTAALSIPVYWFLSQAMGASGIALAAVIGMTAQFLVLYWVWLKRYHDRESTSHFYHVFLKSLMITLIGAGCCWGIKKLTTALVLGTEPMISNLIVLSTASLSGLAVVFLLYELTGVQNFKESIKSLIRR